MNTVDSFRVGENYTNDQIRLSLNLENIGGIRPSLDSQKNVRHVAIITAAEESGKLRTENPYRDRIEGDVLVYTAQGREGDQQITGRNKRLIEQFSYPTPFFGFLNLGKQIYRFLGLLELLRHYQETQADRTGQLRKVWVFEFAIQREVTAVSEEGTEKTASYVEIEQLRSNVQAQVKRLVTASQVADDIAQLLRLVEGKKLWSRSPDWYRRLQRYAVGHRAPK